MAQGGLDEALARIEAAGMPELFARAFRRQYTQAAAHETGYIHERDIDPLGQVTSLDEVVVDSAAVSEALAHTAVLRLNGGLGTSMGLRGPKTALTARDGLTFLDIMARQVLALRARHDVPLPLVLLDSAHTRPQSLAALAAYPDLAIEGLPLDVLQHTEPKLTLPELEPVDWPQDPELEWCPPGHGDFYVALQTTGLLDGLRSRGIRHLFVSNADNLGAVVDPRIPAWMTAQSIPYAAEVCERTLNDRKGGHLAIRRRDGQLVLRDNAQVAPEDMDAFQDVERHRYFHTNNLWIDLDVLADVLAAHDGVLPLPLIVNRKTVDPTRRDSTQVVQLESSVGSAVSTIPGAQALLVPRSRFRPVKTTNELLLLRSDIYRLDDASTIVSTIDHPDPAVALSDHFRLINDFEARFPDGVPSMVGATSLTVDGDITFGADVVCVGDVRVTATQERRIADGALLSGDC